MASNSDFVIEDGVLVEYRDVGGDVVIPRGVKAIGEEAFASCEAITSVTVPDGVASIRRGAFWDCVNLASVALPNNPIGMGPCAFRGCHKLANPDGFVIVNKTLVEYVGPDVDVVIPRGITEVGSQAFCDNNGIASVVIPEGVSAIEDFAFSGCGNLRSVSTPEGVVFIGHGAFMKCRSLQDVTLPESVLSIGDAAFHGCDSIECIRLPRALEEDCGFGKFFDIPYVICYTPEVASIAEFPIYLGGSVFDLWETDRSRAVKGFRYAQEHGITEIDQWEEDYEEQVRIDRFHEADRRRAQIAHDYGEMLYDMMRSSFLDEEGLALETGLDEEDIHRYLMGEKPSASDVIEIAGALDYDPDLFFSSE